MSNKFPWDTSPPEALRISQVAGAESPPVMNTFPVETTVAPAPPLGLKRLPVDMKLPVAVRISHVLGDPEKPLQQAEPSIKTFPLVSCTALAPPLKLLNRFPVDTRPPD